MSRLTRDGIDEPVLRDQIIRREWGQENIHVPCSADHEQDWRPYPVDPSLAIHDDHTYILKPEHAILDWGLRCSIRNIHNNKSNRVPPSTLTTISCDFIVLIDP